ncbi:MAG: hypothetical protein ACK574_09300, partial [Bacteroidota bacterium]
MSTIDTLKQDFEHYRAQADGSAFAEQREAAFGELQQLGIPTIKHEEWKYTNLKFINDINFQASCVHSEAARNYYSEHVVQTLKANRIVFINGSFDASLTQLQPEDAGIVITNLAAARKNHADVFNAHFGKYAEVKGHAMNAMNTALMSDGAFIHVPAGKQTVYPIIITNISDASEVNVLNQPRNLI